MKRNVLMRVDGDNDVFCCIVTVESTLNLTLVPSMLLSSSDHGVYYTYTCACAWIMSMSRNPRTITVVANNINFIYKFSTFIPGLHSKTNFKLCGIALIIRQGRATHAIDH